LSLSPANADGDIDVGPHQLPIVETLNAAALRT
jgi:hypothetical protein